jgi:LmbE family N-acetylglucosaminyl deacetylase
MKFNGIEIQRAMAIYAHPDDAEFGMAGTIAKWVKAGVECTYVMVTNGASGSQDPNITREQLRDTRYAEQRAAAKILGVKNTVFLGYEDGYLYPTLEVRKDVARQIRIHKPDVILCFDPTMRIADTYVNHPDHIAASEVVLRSINPDASTRQMFPELWNDEHLEPHKPKALFLTTFDDKGTAIDIGDVLETKVKALMTHTSQLWPGADEMVRGWAKEAGKRHGYKAAETYRIVRLDDGASSDDETRRPTRRARTTSRVSVRGRRAAQSTRSRSTRAPRKGTASRRKRAR